MVKQETLVWTKVFYTVGDSHSLYGWPMINLPHYEIICCHLGAHLMNSVGLGKFDRRIKKILERLRPDDAICYCFGEIDCRVHAHQHGIDGLAERYMKRLIALMSSAPPVTKFVMGIVPPEVESGALSAGSPEERRSYVRCLNRDLAFQANLHGWRFIDVYRCYADDEGYMRKDLVGWRGHIGNPTPLQASVREVLR